jgi:hypothetical protein
MSLVRSLAAALTAAAVGIVVTPTAAVAAVPVPRPPVALPTAIEVMPPYQPQTFCDPVDKPGPVAFGALLTATYKDTSVVDISRPCGTDTSEHYDGRALDWGAYYQNATQVAEVNAVFAWLFAKDSAGNTNAMLRRLGIMYIIWNKQIWGTWSQKWEPYSCSGVTACHQDHVHFSFDWSGAMKKTSFWTGVVSAPMPPPQQVLTSLTNTASVKVPVTRSSTTTTFVLKAGMTYRLTASGTYRYATSTTALGDAECTHWPSTPAWHPLAPGETSTTTSVRDLVVNRHSTWVPTNGSATGCNLATHTYTMTLRAYTTSPPTVTNNDSNRSDDAGSLTLSVRRVA